MYKTAKNNVKHYISQPIPIPKKTKIHNHPKKSISDYELKLNFFNPDKNSPPNSWNSRLLYRINNN